MADSTQLCGEFAPSQLAPQEQQQPTGSGAVIRSRYRGLSWDKKHQGWWVRIYFSGKQRHVGRFEDDITAAKAYDKAAVYLYGSNAITNFGLEACQVDPTEVSTFIVLAKEQAEQEQLARQHHRQQYPNHSGMPACGYANSYALQQPAYVAQQQQQAMNMSMGMQPQHAMNMHVGFVVPAGMDSSSMGMHAWQQGAGPMHMNMQPTSIAGMDMPAGVPVMATNVVPYPAHLQQQQQGQQQQQVWCPAGSMQPMMQQLSPGHALPGSAQAMQEGHMLAAHPAAAAAAGGAMQTMVGASPMAASTPMLVHSPLQQQQGAGVMQQYILQGGVLLHPMQMGCAVSTAAAPTSLAPAGLPQELVLQHVHSMPAHMGHMSVQGSGEASSPGACGHLGGPTFVQDMVSSLNYAAGAAAGQAGMAASAGLQVQHNQQGMQGMVGAPWVLPANAAAISSGSTGGHGLAQSWPEVPAASMGGLQQQGFPVGSAMLNSSPPFSAASSMSATTSPAFALMSGTN